MTSVDYEMVNDIVIDPVLDNLSLELCCNEFINEAKMKNNDLYVLVVNTINNLKSNILIEKLLK